MTIEIEAPAPLGREAAEARRVLRELMRLHQLRERDRVSVYGVTVSGAHALEVLAERGPLSLSALSAELFVDRSTACRTVGLLEDRGWLARLADARDGRAIRLELTEAGRVLEARLRQDAIWETEALLAALPADDHAAALHLLRELTRASAAHAGVPEPAV
ncbi:MAG TPA: MarR family transcriptional regulator [Longimicrobium sp.]